MQGVGNDTWYNCYHLLLGAYSIISMNDTMILGVITLIVGTILSNVVSKNKWINCYKKY